MTSKDKNLNQNKGQNQHKNLKLKYENIPDAELDAHLKLLKQWLVKYNTFEFDNQSAGKLSTFNIEEIQIILNYKTNFARVKLYIDYLELEHICPNIAQSFRTNFLKYYKYINFITRKILISSKKIKEDTSVLSDFIILNYPFIYAKVTHRNFLSLLNTQNGIIGFAKCFVNKINPPIFLLWAKKIYKTCQCDTKEYRNKFFNVFTKNIKHNSKFHNSYCKICHKDYYHDKKADIFIECQEIELTIQTNYGLMNNCIKVWAFGDLINSVKEGNCISLIAYYISEESICLEKEFEYGYFIALNFNLNFCSLNLLQAADFLLHHQKKNMKSLTNGGMALNEERSISDILCSLQFQRQFINDYFKFIMQNWQSNKKRELETISHLSPYVNNSYQAFIAIILDISLAQRDYVNHNSKLSFLSSNNANYLVEVDNNTTNPNSNIIENSAITNSYNVVFKSKIFDVNNKTNKAKDIQYPISSAMNEDTFKKYFRLSKSISTIETKGDMLLKPFNLIFVFDDIQFDPMYNQLKRYAMELHHDIVVMFPNFTHTRFDKQIFIRFLYQCNNKILFVQNIDLLSKQEAEFIGAIMTENASCSTESNDDLTTTTINNPNHSNSTKSDLYGLNITFWFCCSLNKISYSNSAKATQTSNGINMNSSVIGTSLSLQEMKLKNFDMIISQCEGVFNCSKRQIKSKGIDIINENTFTSFFNDINQSQLNSDTLLNQYSVYEKISNLSMACDSSHYFDLSKEANSIKAARLLEDYFISKRDITRINFNDLFTLLRIAVFTSMLRSHYDKRKIVLPLAIANMNLFDSLIAIVLYEEFTGYKYGNDTQSFSDITNKILFYDYNTVVNQIRAKMMINDNHCNKAIETTMPIIPKTKTKTARIVEMNDNNTSSGIYSLINDPKKNNDINCVICKAISKCANSKEVFFDFIEKVDTFIYKEKEFI